MRLLYDRKSVITGPGKRDMMASAAPAKSPAALRLARYCARVTLMMRAVLGIDAASYCSPAAS
jgi:hypothetical protein